MNYLQIFNTIATTANRIAVVTIKIIDAIVNAKENESIYQLLKVPK